MQQVKIPQPLDSYILMRAKQKEASRIIPLGLSSAGRSVLPLYIGLKNKLGWGGEWMM